MQAQAFSNVGRLALLGLILSVSVLVIVVSVVNGFERELRERVLGLIPAVTVVFRDGLSAGAEAQIEAHPQLQGSPYVQGQVLLVRDGEITTAEVTGIVPEKYGNVTQLFDYTEQKSYEVLKADGFGIVLGATIAERLQAQPGDYLRLVMPVAGVSAAGAVPRQRRMQVVDILRSDSLIDGQAAYVHLQTALKLFRLRQAQGYQLRADDLFDLNPLSIELYERFGEQVRVRTWMDRYGSLYQAIAVQKLTMFFLLLFLVAVAAFNLVSGLVMIVEQRKADIAVLMTLGLDARGVLLVFINLGVVMAVLGIGLGLTAGGVLAMLLPGLFSSLSELFSAQLMSQYFINYLPSEVRPLDLVVIGGISFLLAGLATLFPAWRATRVLPSEVLNHE